MLQTIDGREVYVVEFDTMPELPITGLTEEEEQIAWYHKLLNMAGGVLGFHTYVPTTGDYAYALNSAIMSGMISEPGKYGIHVDKKNQRWDVFKIIEK